MRRRSPSGCAPACRLADARAQVGELTVVPHDPVLDQDWLDRLAQGCARYSPLVALDAPDGLILDIAGAEHLHDGEAGLVTDVEMRLARLGMTLRHALGPTADAARALARYQTRPAPDEGQAIRRLPVAALELETEATTALVRAGLKTIGDLASRPMANIAARFGADAAMALRRLLGDAPSPLDPRAALPPSSPTADLPNRWAAARMPPGYLPSSSAKRSRTSPNAARAGAISARPFSAATALRAASRSKPATRPATRGWSCACSPSAWTASPTRSIPASAST